MLSIKPVIKTCSFKVFRKTTRFKKYNRGITRMVRKKYTRRKHLTNAINLSYITKYWVLHYLSMRQFERFYSSLGQFKVSAYATESSVFNIRLFALTNKNGINLLSCSKPVLYKHINSLKNSEFLINYSNHSRSSFIQTNSIENITQSLEIFPNVIKFDSSFYSPDEINSLTNNNESAILLKSLDAITFNHSLILSTNLYHILILLTLYNIKCN